MKNSLLPILLSLASVPSVASDFCERLPVDPGFPAGIGGQYEIVGRDPETGSAYTGTLAVSYGKSSYALTRRVQGVSVNGDAWVERCGMDKIVRLYAKYYTKPTTEISCTVGGDGDNYYRLTCRTREDGGTWPGLEAWFQNH